MSEIDPKLSRIYREASAEGPPAAVDAAILAAARSQSMQSRRRERASWVRWMAPASALATLVVAVSLAFLVEREPPGEDSTLRQTPPRQPNAPPARSIDPAKETATDRAVPAAAVKKETPAVTAPLPAPIAASPASAPAVFAPVPPSAAPAQDPAPPAALAFPADGRAKATESRISAQKAAESESIRQSNVARDSALGSAGASSPAAPAAAGKLAPLRSEAARRAPQAWLDEIVRLKREGRDKEAAEQLAEFRKAYPAHTVPEGLRDLQ